MCAAAAVKDTEVTLDVTRLWIDEKTEARMAEEKAINFNGMYSILDMFIIIVCS